MLTKQWLAGIPSHWHTRWLAGAQHRLAGFSSLRCYAELSACSTCHPTKTHISRDTLTGADYGVRCRHERAVRMGDEPQLIPVYGR